MNTDQPTRRALLRGAATLPALALATIAASAEAAPTDTRAWDHAVAALQIAEANSEAADKAFNAAADIFDAECEALEKPDTKKLTGAFFGTWQALRTIDVAKARAEFLEGEGKWWSMNPKRKAEKLAEWDKLEAYQRAEAAIKERLDYNRLADECDRLGDIAYEARWALFHTPAPNGEALLWKARHLLNPDSTSWSEGTLATFHADADRLLGAKA